MKVLVIFAAVAAVVIARPTVTPWTVPMLDQALTSPNVNPEIVPILIDALNTIMHNIYTGAENQHTVDVALPAGVPIFIDPVESGSAVPVPVLPEPEEKPAFSSPLVEIIINVDGKPQAISTEPAVPRPIPVATEEAPAVPRPIPVETEEAPAVPRPIPEAQDPIDIIAVNPVGFEPVKSM